jgi:hypothetical protein
MGATAGTRTPLAGQARAQQQQSSLAPGVRDDAYYNQMRKDFSKAVATGGGNVDDAERSFDKSIAAIRQAPAADNYFDTGKFNTIQNTYQKTLGRNPTQEELGKNYSSIEDLERSLQAQRSAPQPARQPSRFGIKSFR